MQNLQVHKLLIIWGTMLRAVTIFVARRHSLVGWYIMKQNLGGGRFAPLKLAMSGKAPTRGPC